MGLENLCNEIEHNSKARAAQILSDAKKEARKIVEDARASASASSQAAKKQALQFSKAEEQERITAAQLEEQKIISDAKDEAVRKCTRQVWEEFSQARKQPGYSKKLRRWAELALEELSSSGSVLRCAPEDKQILISAGFKLSPKPLECAGGVVAETKDGKVIVDYTLESIFEQNREKIVHTIHSKLFSHDEKLLQPIALKPSAKKRHSPRIREHKKGSLRKKKKR